MFICTPAPPKPGQVLRIRMQIGGGFFQLEGTVVHATHHGMGVRLDVAGARVV